MTAKDLKNALLQEAVQGKLVPQIASEGNARDLLEEIRKARGESLPLATARKRSSATPSAGTPRNAPMEISEDEIPFDIPESWCWCRLGDVVKNVNYGTSAKSHQSGKVPVLRMGNITKDGKLSFENLVYTSDEKEIETYKLFPGDMLFNRTNSAEWVGKTTVYKGERPAIFAGYIIRYTPILIDSEYMNVVMNTSYQKKWCSEVKTNGVQQCNINAQNLLKFILPLPPLAEQKRIVAAIEKFMPLIEEYGKKETVLNELNTQIGTLTKKAILQEAVQGKLVPQIPAEGNAKDLLEQIKAQKAALIKEGKIKKEKPLPEITEDEIPFDIPDSWCWCRLGEIVNKLTDGTHRTPKYVEKGIPFLSVKNLSSGKLDFENTKFITPEEHKELYTRCNPEKGDMLLTKVGTTGIPVINDSDIEFSLFVSVALLKFSHEYINEKYFLYLLQSPLVQEQAQENTKGVGNKNWVMDAIAKTVLVLPPLSEQKRIVAAIEQLLPLCEKLGK